MERTPENLCQQPLLNFNYEICPVSVEFTFNTTLPVFEYTLVSTPRFLTFSIRRLVSTIHRLCVLLISQRQGSYNTRESIYKSSCLYHAAIASPISQLNPCFPFNAHHSCISRNQLVELKDLQVIARMRPLWRFTDFIETLCSLRTLDNAFRKS